MAEFVLVETYVEHSYHDNYLMGVYFDGWNTRHESLGYGNGILNGGYADAPSEVIERYRRVKSLRRRLEKRAFYKEAAEKMGLRSYHEARELARACTNEEFEQIVRLLSTKKFRSSFRQSLASQVRAWVKVQILTNYFLFLLLQVCILEGWQNGNATVLKTE